MFFLRILWPLLVYEVPISIVETLEKKVNGNFSQWLGQPRSLSCITLDRHYNKLQIPLKFLEEGFKVTRAREGMQSSGDEARRAVLGSFSTPDTSIAKGKEKCCLVQEEMRAAVEEKRSCKTVGIRSRASGQDGRTRSEGR